MTSMFRLEFSASSRAGKGKRNEDYYGIKSYSNSFLVVLADGMGNTDCAYEAAELAVESVLDSFDMYAPVVDALGLSLLRANEMIADASQKRGCKMGCAMTIAYVHGEKLYYVSLGNVRIYLQKDNSLERITLDDVYVASNGNRFLTRSVSGKEIEDKIDIKEINLMGVSSILLETDGYYLNDEFDDASIVEIQLFGMEESAFCTMS